MINLQRLHRPCHRQLIPTTATFGKYKSCRTSTSGDSSTDERQSEADLFEYTSGRWIFNEEIRRTERRLKFDVDALKTVIATSIDRPVADIRSLRKLAEGGFNRIIQATFTDGREVLARLPYPFLAPKHYATASEAAILTFLHTKGIPVPRVLDYSATHANAIGSEYLLLEKVQGSCLGNIWYIIDNEAREKINHQVIDIEQKLLRTALPASGSLYHLGDLRPEDTYVPLQDSGQPPQQLVVGPTCRQVWHHKERTNLHEFMGPWKTFLECFAAPAKRELQWCQKYGKPRQHEERHLRPMHNLKEISPHGYMETLRDYLKLAPSLDIPSDHVLSRPVLRHPDLSPNNILINEDYDIVALIDWQHADVRPLCLAAGIPRHFQNWGDSESERLCKPAARYPDDYESLSLEDKSKVVEVLRRRLVHYLYATKTMAQIPEHFDAISQDNVVKRGRLYEHASWPWLGNSLTLKYDLTLAARSWPLTLKASPLGGDDVVPREATCPLEYSQEYVSGCTRDWEKQQELEEEAEEMCAAMGIGSQGWVEDDDHYEKAREIAGIIKGSLVDEAENEVEKRAAQDHFPFEDHEEY